MTFKDETDIMIVDGKLVNNFTHKYVTCDIVKGEPVFYESLSKEGCNYEWEPEAVPEQSIMYKEYLHTLKHILKKREKVA